MGRITNIEEILTVVVCLLVSGSCYSADYALAPQKQVNIVIMETTGSRPKCIDCRDIKRDSQEQAILDMFQKFESNRARNILSQGFLFGVSDNFVTENVTKRSANSGVIESAFSTCSSRIEDGLRLHKWENTQTAQELVAQTMLVNEQDRSSAHGMVLNGDRNSLHSWQSQLLPSYISCLPSQGPSDLDDFQLIEVDVIADKKVNYNEQRTHHTGLKKSIVESGSKRFQQSFSLIESSSKQRKYGSSCIHDLVDYCVSVWHFSYLRKSSTMNSDRLRAYENKLNIEVHTDTAVDQLSLSLSQASSNAGAVVALGCVSNGDLKLEVGDETVKRARWSCSNKTSIPEKYIDGLYELTHLNKRQVLGKEKINIAGLNKPMIVVSDEDGANSLDGLVIGGSNPSVCRFGSRPDDAVLYNCDKSGGYCSIPWEVVGARYVEGNVLELKNGPNCGGEILAYLSIDEPRTEGELNTTTGGALDLNSRYWDKQDLVSCSSEGLARRLCQVDGTRCDYDNSFLTDGKSTVHLAACDGRQIASINHSSFFAFFYRYIYSFIIAFFAIVVGVVARYQYKKRLFEEIYSEPCKISVVREVRS